jgi:hypothetical protein
MDGWPRPKQRIDQQGGEDPQADSGLLAHVIVTYLPSFLSESVYDTLCYSHRSYLYIILKFKSCT